MRLITNVGTTDGANPGDEVDVPDNEAPGLIALGFMSPLSEEDSSSQDAPSEDASKTEDAAEEGDGSDEDRYDTEETE